MPLILISVWSEYLGLMKRTLPSWAWWAVCSLTDNVGFCFAARFWACRALKRSTKLAWFSCRPPLVAAMTVLLAELMGICLGSRKRVKGRRKYSPEAWLKWRGRGPRSRVTQGVLPLSSYGRKGHRARASIAAVPPSSWNRRKQQEEDQKWTRARINGGVAKNRTQAPGQGRRAAQSPQVYSTWPPLSDEDPSHCWSHQKRRHFPPKTAAPAVLSLFME